MSDFPAFSSIWLKLIRQKLFITHRNLHKSKSMMAKHHHSLESVLEVFKPEENIGNPLVKELLDIFHKEVKSTENSKINISQNPHPFIVLEGLDAAGKSTVSEKLSAILNAKQRMTPPKCISHLRSAFDSNLSTRTAFYSLGNYIESACISKVIQESPVILDRFWHSTTAYSLAQNIHNENYVSTLPMAGDSVYEWPADLIKPNLVIYLDVSEDERVRRHEARNTTNTKQESLLKDSKIFRQNIRTAYERMREPNVYFINADSSVDDIISSILEKVKYINN